MKGEALEKLGEGFIADIQPGTPGREGAATGRAGFFRFFRDPPEGLGTIVGLLVWGVPSFWGPLTTMPDASQQQLRRPKKGIISRVPQPRGFRGFEAYKEKKGEGAMKMQFQRG